MAVINKVSLPSGDSFDVSTLSIPFGQVDDTSTATVFTATIPGITALYDGVCVYLTNGVVTSASGWTLNINNLGAKPVYQSMAAASRTTTIFNVAYTGLFVYNSSRVEGGCWDYFYGSGSTPDWEENDSTSSSYVQNRTHYRTSLGYVAPIDLTNMFNNEWGWVEESNTVGGNTYTKKMYGMYTPQFQVFIEHPEVLLQNTFATFDLEATSSSLVIDGVEQQLTNLYVPPADEYSDTYLYAYNSNYCVFIYQNYYDNIMSTVGLYCNDNTNVESIVYNAKIVNELFSYSTLNSLYLDGYLITKGEGLNSEIFNGYSKNSYNIPNKLSLEESHVEGVANNNANISFYLTGDANATEYTVNNVYADYTSILNPWINDSELYDANGATGCFIIGYSIGIDEQITSISLNRTLNAENDIENEGYTVYVPASIASSGSHVEGTGALAFNGSHAEGNCTYASHYSHAEGEGTIASGHASHAEGFYTTASGTYSHAEGSHTTASGNYSHAEGAGTTAQRRSQHVFGEYNVLDTTGSNAMNKGSYIEIVGKGTSNTNRSNARTLDWSGNEVLAGKLTVGTGPTNNMDVATKQYVDNAVSGGSGGILYITITGNQNDGFATTANFDDVYAAYQNGYDIKAVNGTEVYNLSNITSSGMSFSKNTASMLQQLLWAKSSGNITYSRWVAANLTISSLADTTITSPTNGQVLMYNSTTSKWENTSLPIYNGGVSS